MHVYEDERGVSYDIMEDRPIRNGSRPNPWVLKSLLAMNNN